MFWLFCFIAGLVLGFVCWAMCASASIADTTESKMLQISLKKAGKDNDEFNRISADV